MIPMAFKRAAAAAVLAVFGFASAAAAQQPSPEAPADDVLQAIARLPRDEYLKGVIESLQEEGEREIAGVSEKFKIYLVRLTSGAETGKTVSIDVGDLVISNRSRDYAVGDKVVVVKSYQPDQTANYYIADNYRVRPLAWIALIFFAVAVIFGRMRGFTSVLGLATTVVIIIYFVVPRIVAGGDPLMTCLIAGLMIAAVSLYLAHGFSKRTTLSLVSMLLTLAISAWIAVKWVAWSDLFGTGSEDALFLIGFGLDNLDLRGLFLGGIILGLLGILDDITTAQTAVVEELKRANPSLNFIELYRRGLSVGREHIASLVNTLFLAYAGAALPLFLLFAVNQAQPLWFTVNFESIAEEIVRTLSGSIGLILAVPISTALAASYYSERAVAGTAAPHTHHH